MADYSDYQHFKTERHGRVLKLSFNRPEKLNAVNSALHGELARIFYDVNQDNEAFAVLLTGEGRAFCAGGDIEGMETTGGDWGKTVS